LELLFLKPVAAGTFGEVHNVDLRGREKTERLLVEEEQSHVPGEGRLRRTAYNVHLTAQHCHR
jgi:hypothetical protein